MYFRHYQDFYRQELNVYKAFHKENLGIKIYSLISSKDRKNLAQVDYAWRQVSLEFEAQSFLMLKQRILEHKVVLVKSDGELHQEILLKILGQGGAKKAIEISENRVLMLPNMNYDPIYTIVRRWSRMVNEEVVMSELLSKIGLLCPGFKRVSLSFQEDLNKQTIPAYVCETFEELGKKKDWFIIDTKNLRSSTWKQGTDFLFHSMEDRLNEKSWDLVLGSLVTDITKIIIYGIPIERDSLNLAIVKKSSEPNVSQYEIRYFGFDFSHKSKHLSFPDVQKKPLGNTGIDKINQYLDSMLSSIFYYEFYNAHSESEKNNSMQLKNQLLRKYALDIVSIVSKL